MSTEREDEIVHLLRENTALVRENNELLRKLRRSGIIEFWIRVVWYALLIGLPFAVYFYLLEPYFAAFGSSYEQFRIGMSEIPGFKVFQLMFPTE